MNETLWKICGAGFAAASTFITVAVAACLLLGYFQAAALVLLFGMAGMVIVLVVLWRAAIQQDEMFKH